MILNVRVPLSLRLYFKLKEKLGNKTQSRPHPLTSTLILKSQLVLCLRILGFSTFSVYATIKGGSKPFFYHRGSNGAPNCSSNHPDLPHIGFDGSRTNGIAVAAQNVPA